MDFVRQERRDPNIPEFKAVGHYYNLCIPSVLPPIFYEMVQLYKWLDGLKNETYESLLRLPAIYVYSCDIIKEELQKISGKDSE